MIKDTFNAKGFKVEAFGTQEPGTISFFLYRAYAPAQNRTGTQTFVESIKFQRGPVPDNGVNGLTLELTLELCKHRLEAYQAGDYNSEYNAKAIEHISKAIESLEARTKDREQRGVEGLFQK